MKILVRRHNLLLTLITMTLMTKAYANSTAELKVSGKIVPSSCNVTLGNTGASDLGKIDIDKHRSASILAPIPLTINCDGQRQVAFQLRDNREAYRVDGLPIKLRGDESVTTSSKHFGLKGNNDKKAGAWAVNYTNLHVDGQTAETLSAADATSLSVGAKSKGDRSSGIYNGFWYSWATPGSLTAAVGKVFTSDLVISTAILPEQDNELNVDGSATIVIRYL